MTAVKLKPIVSYVTLFFFLFTVILHLTSGDNGTLHLHKRSRRSPPIAINLERIQLLKDALGWMTFRKNGELMTDAQLEPLFLETLKEKYRSSKFYRTFLIAFQQGVLPRLTLNEGDPCEPDYTRKYKNPFNSSVTWHFQKKFTFESYDMRSSEDLEYCDYRQGLFCKTTTRTCGCPDGAVMQSIGGGSSEKRCLLQDNEICALIDIDHGNDPKHSALASNLYHMIFNLEKPPSCKVGTQCRFKDGSRQYPLCYDVNSGPWYPPPPVITSNSVSTSSWTISLGEECTLGLYANPGSCETPSWTLDIPGTVKGYICYNFGPPRSQRTSNSGAENKTGFCAHEWGSFGITQQLSSIDEKPSYPVLFIGHVHPRSVPLRGSQLKEYYEKYLQLDLFWKLQGHPGSSEEELCSVKKTEEMEEIWRYYASLEDDPPPGMDYVVGATQTELDTKLESVRILVNSVGGWCKVYWHIQAEFWSWTYPSLKCVAEGTPDADGNDGKCWKPGNIDDKEYAEMIENFKVVTGEANRGQKKEEEQYRQDIVRDYPEMKCSPNLGSPPQARVHNYGDTLEEGYCPDGFVCFQDYSDDRGIYNKYECSVRKPDQKLEVACHEDRDGIRYGECEGQQLDKRLTEEVEKMAVYSKLARGQACRYDLERDIRNFIENGQWKTKMNKYKLLGMLWRGWTSGGELEGFCGRDRLMECTENNICECLEGTEPRKVTVGGKEYISDYCYFSTGSCKIDVTGYKRLAYTASEEENLVAHYGKEDYYCENKNLCVFFDEKNKECTIRNTGKTGHDLKPDGGGGGIGNAGGSGWREVGGAGNLKGNMITTGWSLGSSIVIIFSSIWI